MVGVYPRRVLRSYGDGGGGGSRYTVESLTFSGGLITDAVREAGVEGDGLTPPAGVGPWPAATNLVTNGGFETDTTGWNTVGTNTIERSTEQAKFGAASCKCTIGDSPGNIIQNSGITLTAAAHAFSVWVYIPSSYDGTEVRLLANAGFGSMPTASVDADMSLRDQWQRLSVAGTPVSGDLTGNPRLQNPSLDATAGSVIYCDDWQIELGSIATPYIETDGSTESRTAGRVFDDANEIAIDSSQFAVAVRWNPGIANTALSTGTAVLFERVVDANNLVRGLYDFANARYELQRLESGSGSSHTKAHTFTAQSSQTVIFQGTPTGLTISVGGDFDAETANTAVPDVSTADLDYGSSAGTSSFLDGNARFISTFTGELTNDDAARIAAMPSPPTWAQLVGALPSSAGVDTLWPCSTGQFFKAA